MEKQRISSDWKRIIRSAWAVLKVGCDIFTEKIGDWRTVGFGTIGYGIYSTSMIGRIYIFEVRQIYFKRQSGHLKHPTYLETNLPITARSTHGVVSKLVEIGKD